MKWRRSPREWVRALWNWMQALPIRTKLAGIVWLSTCFFIFLMTFEIRAITAANLEHDLEERGIAIARALAEDATDLLLTQNTFGLHQKIRTTLETNPDVRYVFIEDANGIVQAHSFPNRVPPSLLTVNHLDTHVPYQVLTIQSEEGLLTDIAVPILDGDLGTVRLGMSHARIQSELIRTTNTVILLSLSGLAAASLAVYVLASILLTPISTLVEATERMRAGDLDQHVPIRFPDEVGVLTNAFNRMARQLSHARRELEQRNQHLQALNTFSRQLSAQTTLDTLLETAMREAAHLLGCESAWILLAPPDENGDAPRLQAAWGVSEAFRMHEMNPSSQRCPCYDVLAKTVDWRHPIMRHECPRLARAFEQRTSEIAFDRHLSIPLISHDRPLGLLNLALRPTQTLSEEQIALAEALGHQIGIALDAELQRQRVLRELAERENLRAQLLERVLAAQEEERRRIARELHDEAGQALTSLMVGFGILQQNLEDPYAVAANLADLKLTTNRILENLHRLAIDLRPASLDHVGLVAALRQYADVCSRQSGLSIDFETVCIDEHQRFPPEIETTIYRIVQEALTNAMRHAQANHVDIILECRNGHLIAIVEDDGVGFDPNTINTQEHLGVFGMRERAAMVGGTLTIESSPGGGTTVHVEVPYEHSYSHR